MFVLHYFQFLIHCHLLCKFLFRFLLYLSKFCWWFNSGPSSRSFFCITFVSGLVSAANVCFIIQTGIKHLKYNLHSFRKKKLPQNTKPSSSPNRHPVFFPSHFFPIPPIQLNAFAYNWKPVRNRKIYIICSKMDTFNLKFVDNLKAKCGSGDRRPEMESAIVPLVRRPATTSSSTVWPMEGNFLPIRWCAPLLNCPDSSKHVTLS